MGTGAVAAGTGGPLAAVTGVIAALGAATVLKVSAGRSRRRTITEDSKFIRDLTVATLDREIPVLVDRCLDAGLVPLFVVDELDKVEGLSDRITSLVRRLKKLVAERAFFCFLSDRSYFEEMRRRTRNEAYPIEYTYFTHDLFIVFDHRDLHRFLLRIVALTGPVTRPAPAPSGTGDGTPAPAPPSPSDEVEDLRILPYVLLHQAKMHPIDLRRELTRLSDQDGYFVLEPGEWRSRANLCDLMIQVAVEMVLEGQAMEERLRREPRFRRLAHDALYYPSREWENGSERLDLGDGAEAAFGDWLTRRMGHDGEAGAAAPDPAAAAADPLLSEQDRRFLFERVRELARLLADPQGLRDGVPRLGATPRGRLDPPGPAPHLGGGGIACARDPAPARRRRGPARPGRGRRREPPLPLAPRLLGPRAATDGADGLEGGSARGRRGTRSVRGGRPSAGLRQDARRASRASPRPARTARPGST